MSKQATRLKAQGARRKARDYRYDQNYRRKLRPQNLKSYLEH